MFSKKIILFLKRDSLELYIADGDGPKNRLLFPPEIIKYEEILDEAKFESLITSFLQKEIAPNQKVTILLSPDILFQKTISSYSRKQFHHRIKQLRKAKLKNLQMKFHLTSQKRQPSKYLLPTASILSPPTKNFTCQLLLLAKNSILKSKQLSLLLFLASPKTFRLPKMILTKFSTILN